LGIAGELSVEAGHADQDHAHIAAVEEVPELFEATCFQPVRFVDNEELGA